MAEIVTVVPHEFLFDADAFHWSRNLDFLPRLVGRPGSFVMTGYVAKFELNPLQTVLAELQAEGRLRVESVVEGTAEFSLFRTLRREGRDKGEAESVAWAVCRNPGSCLFRAIRARAPWQKKGSFGQPTFWGGRVSWSS